MAAAVGGKIAFISYRDGEAEIYLMNPDGTGADPPYQQSGI